MQGNFEHSGVLVRFMLRRERVVSSVWIILLVMFSIILAPGITTMFPDQGVRDNFAVQLNNPIMVSMMGPIFGIENYSVGAMYGGMMLLWYVIAVAAMNIFLVVRHTRADEEGGRAEVVRSLPVGRLANIHATMITAVIINGILALLTGLGLAACGIESMGFWGSMLYGLASGVTGLIFAAITMLFCQLSSNASGAAGLSFLSIGIFYMVRAAGDLNGNEILSCLSPLGLVQRSQVYVENHIWPTLLLLLQTAGIMFAAYKLNSIRDLGQGFIAAKPGRKNASPALLSSFGLSCRLLRGMIIAWFIIMFMLGASYGSVIGDIGTFIQDSPEYLAIIGVPVEMLEFMTDAQKEKIIIESFGTFITIMMTLICFVPVLNSVLRIRAEERDGRSEHVLARVVSRSNYLAGYVIIAFIASIIMQLATAVGLYMSTAAVTGDNNPFVFDTLIKAYLNFLPALWVMIGIAVVFIGVFPKATGAIWGYYGFVCFTSFLGPMVFPENSWIFKLSPMTYIPEQPFENMTPLIVLTIVAIVFIIKGFVFYRKRDMITG
ncbi:MAG: hypothetical protein FWD13_02285 [Treponema sp.]|nr:hypothetical protein [Treponema sp.]